MVDFYSPTTGGFYCSDLHNGKMPDDVIAISASLKDQLITGVNCARQKINPPDEAHNTLWLSDPPAPPLGDVQKNQIAIINAEYETACSKLKQDTPGSEILTWDIQKIEAETWAVNSETATPFCDGIAAARGMDRQVLLEKVLAKVAAYNQYMSFLTGIRQRGEDRILAAVTIDDVLAVSWQGLLKKGSE